MNEKSRRYDRAFKKEIAQMYLDNRRTAPSLATELGVHVNTIYKWARMFRADPQNAFPGSGHMKPDEEALAKSQRRVRELEEEVEILKKRRHTSQKQLIKYRFVHEYRFKYAVSRLCRVLKVSRSGYYRWASQGCPDGTEKDVVILTVIRGIERDNGNNYGVRRVHRALNDEYGIKCGYGKTARIMRQYGIKARIVSRCKPQSTKADQKYEADEMEME